MRDFPQGWPLPRALFGVIGEAPFEVSDQRVPQATSGCQFGYGLYDGLQQLRVLTRVSKRGCWPTSLWEAFVARDLACKLNKGIGSSRSGLAKACSVQDHLLWKPLYIHDDW